MTKPVADFAKIQRPSLGASLSGRKDWPISSKTRSTRPDIQGFRLFADELSDNRRGLESSGSSVAIRRKSAHLAWLRKRPWRRGHRFEGCSFKPAISPRGFAPGNFARVFPFKEIRGRGFLKSQRG